MFCINSEPTYQGKYRVVIQCDETPDTMPTTGEGVTGLSDNAVLAPGSILYIVPSGETYFLGEPDGDTPGEWIKWGGGTESETDTEDDTEGGEG